MKRSLLTTICLFFASVVLLAQPNGTGTYYQKAHGKKGRELKTAMYEIIKNPSVLTYDDLWDAFNITDERVKEDGTKIIWDMYSSISSHPVGTYSHTNSSEGSGINREHSMPKSWFNPTDKKYYTDIKPMFSDLMHLIPADGNINTRRGDLPYGVVADNPVPWTSEGGFSKIGTCAVDGYNKKVFEPNDQYKGDLARIYFYMITCYEKKSSMMTGNHCGTWTSDMFNIENDDAFQPLTSWAIKMLMKWSVEDPVDEKETNRNEAVWGLQGNRNPFVDYPGLETLIWNEENEDLFSFDGSDATIPVVFTPAKSTEVNLNKSFFGVDWSNNSVKNTRPYMERYPLTNVKDGITVIYNYGIEGRNMYANDSQIRLYKYNTLTFRTDDGYMTEIEFKVPNNGNANNKHFFADGVELEGYKWTGNANEVTFTTTDGNGHIQITKAAVTVANPSGIEQLMAERFYDDNIYTLQGVRVDADQLRPGIYIKHGRKFVVK